MKFIVDKIKQMTLKQTATGKSHEEVAMKPHKEGVEKTRVLVAKDIGAIAL